MRFAALSLAVTGLTFSSAAALAAELTVSVEIPRLSVAEYHKPYVAIWLENKADKSVTNLAVWYDVKLKKNEGTKWLKDMRQWWRSTGRELQMPADGLSGATRAPGTHEVSFKPQIEKLKAGEYTLLVEAAREVGGREILRLPLNLPAGEAAAQGKHELGAVKAVLKP